MAYISISKTKDNIVIIDEKTESGTEIPIGEMLFSFLDLDLKKYGQLYNLSHFLNDFNYEDMKLVMKEYPKTAKLYKQYLNNSDLKMYDNDDLRNLLLYFLLDNQDDFSQLYNHICFEYSDASEILSIMTYSDFAQDLNFYDIQTRFRKIIDFCFLEDDVKLAELTPKERYYLFCAINPDWGVQLSNKLSIYFNPMRLYNEIRNSAFEKLKSPDDFMKPNDIDLLGLVNDNIIKKIKEKSAILEVNICSTVYDFLAFDMTTLLFRNSIIKKCANCGKLFIPSGKYNTDCCDRIPDGEKYSCKKIMARERRKEKLKENPIIKEYERAYKRKYARIASHKMTNEDFRLWVEEASKERDKVMANYKSDPSEKLITDFKKFLGNK